MLTLKEDKKVIDGSTNPDQFQPGHLNFFGLTQTTLYTTHPLQSYCHLYMYPILSINRSQ